MPEPTTAETDAFIATWKDSGGHGQRGKPAFDKAVERAHARTEHCIRALPHEEVRPPFCASPSRHHLLKRLTVAGSIVCSVACLAVIGVSPSHAEPLFPNSVVSNDIDFILTDDPMVSYGLIDEGRSRQEMPASLTAKSLWQGAAYVLEINYDDGATVALWADENFESGEAVKGYATKIADALGKLPKALRTKLNRVILHQGDRVATSEHVGHFVIMYAENIDKRVATHDLEETVFHEVIHATLEFGHALSDEWVAAQKADGDFCTTYAAEKPEQEDLPESALFAYTLIHHPGRMSGKVEAAVKRIMPNRIEYLRAVFGDLEAAVNKRPPPRQRASMPMDYIRQNDPGVAFTVKDAGKAPREHLLNDLVIKGEVMLGKLSFEDGVDIEVQVSPAIKDLERALAIARALGESLAKMPALMRQRLASIRLVPGGEEIGVEAGGQFIIVGARFVEREADLTDFDEILFLAVARAGFDREHGGHKDWLTAQELDPVALINPTDRARNPLLAETMLIAHVLNTYRDRIPAAAEAAIRAAIPNRLSYVERVLELPSSH